MSDYIRPPIRKTARQLHKCVACFGPIAVGELYVTQTGHWDARAFRNKFHEQCFAALLADADGGRFEFSPGELEPPKSTTQ